MGYGRRISPRWALLGLLLGPVLLVWTIVLLALHHLTIGVLPYLVPLVFAAATLGLLATRGARAALLTLAAGSVAALLLFSLHRPTNHGSWQTDVAHLPEVAIEGNRVRIRRLRDFTQVGEEIERRYVDRDFDLERLAAVDLVVSYWSGSDAAMAHTMLSFDFGGGDVLCLSVEARKRPGQEYSPLAGLFRRYGLIYVLGTERDLIGRRADPRGEELFLFRTTATPAAARDLFVGILDVARRLPDEPAFYDTLRRNCTTELVTHVDRILPQPLPFSRRFLLNGYSAEEALVHGLLKSDVPYAVLKERARITDLARRPADVREFSLAIRKRLD